ncbi:hypothetical protein JCM8208_006861 [Rhodotorula glutinis]
MFYNTEVLTSRKGGFAVFWLAATIGARGTTAVRKLSRKELLTCNIVKAWCVPILFLCGLRTISEKVIQPDEPLALRLSANLLFGISRVFSHKYALYAGDVQQVQQALRKVITDAALTMPDITLGPELPLIPVDQAVAQAPYSAKETGIDLHVNPRAVVDMQLDWELGLDWHLPGAAPPAAEDEYEEEMFLSPAQSLVAASPAGRAPAGAYQAREADITLQEPQLHDYPLEEYVGMEGFEGEQLPGGPAFGEGEEGLLEGISPELDLAIRAGSAGRGSAAGAAPQYGASSSAVGHGADLGGFDDFFIQPEFGGEGYIPQGAEGEETFAERVRREQEEGRARLEGPERRSPTPLGEGDLSRDVLEAEGTPSSTTRKRVSDAIDLAEAKAKEPVRKVKKLKLVPIDRSTELDDGLFREMRESYPARMQAEREAAEQKQRDNEAHQRAMDLVFGAPGFLAAPELAAFWKKEVAGQMPSFEGGKAADEKKRLAAGLPPLQRAPRRTTEVMRGAAGERLSEQPVGAQAGPHEFAEDVFLPHEFGGEMEHGRDLGGFGEQFHFDDEIEHGRAASAAALSGSRRASALPWAAEVPTSDVGGPGRMAGPSSAAGGSRVSMEEAPAGRTPSLLQSPGRAASVGELLGEQEGELVGLEERRFSRSPSPHASVSGRAPSAVVEPGLRETESLKFLSYARRQQKLGEQLLFSDIVPIGDTNAATVAQALYHLLCLATKGLVKVEQPQAYGLIVVDIR